MNALTQAGRRTRTGTLTALLVNLVLAAAKLAVGLLSGAAVLLAEAAHSFADAVNQLFLLAGLRLGGVKKDDRRPAAQGKDLFYGLFLAALLLFVGAAVWSIALGVRGLLDPRPITPTRFVVDYVVLAVALLAQALALASSLRDARAAARARGRTLWGHVQATRDTSLKVPLYEDAAGIAGVLIAGLGLALAHATGDPRWDAVGALLIGAVLLFVAWTLAVDSRAQLLGEALEAEDRRRLRDVLHSFPEVVHVARILTMHLGPEDVLVNCDVQVRAGLASGEAEDLLDRLNHRLQTELPEVCETFIELHSGDSKDRIRARVGPPRHG